MEIKKIFLKLDKIGEKISQNHLIKFDSRSILVILFSFILFIGAVTLKLHGSSISIWDSTLHEKNTGFIFGKAKSIRSDEWLVQTTQILSQVKNGFPTENLSIGAGKAPLIRDLPTNTYLAIFQPHYWGFHFLDTERGFSFFWNIKLFGLFIGFFLLLMLLTRSNFWLSFFGSIWLLFSSFIEWWFSISMTQMIAYFSFSIVSFAYILFSQKNLGIALGSLVFILSSISFILLLYPPFQITLAYLEVFITIGLIIRNREFVRKNIFLKIFFLALIAVTISLILLNFYQEAKNTITLTQNTAYPGKRVSPGGEVGLAQYFSGFFGYYLTQGKYPKNIGNVCEASSFILLFPIAIFGVAYNFFKKRKSDTLLIAVSLYLIFLSIWILWGFPPLIAKALLLSFVPSSRAILGVGVASIIAVVLFLSDKKNYQYFKLDKKYVLLLFPILLALGFLMNRGLNNFLSPQRLIIASLFFTLIIFWLLNRKTFLFAMAVSILVILSTYDVNPVSSGLSPIFNKTLYREVSEIRKDEPGAKWIVFGDRKIADFIKTTGANVVNGVQFPPNLDFIRSLGENRENEVVYNRFAHIGFSPNNDETASFQLKQFDYYLANISPCSNKIRTSGINRIIFTTELTDEYLSCLSPKDIIDINGIKVLELIN